MSEQEPPVPCNFPRLSDLIELLMQIGKDPIFDHQGGGPLSIRTMDEDAHRRLRPLVRMAQEHREGLSGATRAWFDDLARGLFAFIQVKAAIIGGQSFSEIVLEEDLKRAAREVKPGGGYDGP